jgi:phage I-like protein
MKTSTTQEPIKARGMFESPAAATDTIMYMPGGVHRIHASKGDEEVTMDVLVDQSAAEVLQASLVAAHNTRQRPYFDFDHEDGPAAAWPKAFVWQDAPEPGIYAKVEWSDVGQASILGKRYRAFSPQFFASDDEPARIAGAGLNMGGLVNNPAFKALTPLWAKNTGDTMPETQTPVVTAQSVDTTQQDNAAQIAAKDAEISTLRNEIKARRKADADKAVKTAVARGAIPAADETVKAKWANLIESDPSNEVLLALLPGNPALQDTGARASKIECKEGPGRILGAFAAIACKQHKIQGFDPVAQMQRGEAARELASFFAREISGKDAVLDCPISAADYTDPAGNLGTLTGTLVAQRTLQLFKYDLPILSRITTDFSDQPANFGQTVNTRIVSVPSVTEYNTTTGFTTPTGTPTTTDVNISLDKHIGVPLRFTANTLASTVRNLFGELAPAASYAIAEYFANKLYALFTLANYTSYAVQSATVPTAYPSYKLALSDVSRGRLTEIAAAMNQAKVPRLNRTVLFNSQYFAKLTNDPSLTTFFAAMAAPRMISDSELPKLATFIPIEAPNLPTTGNLVGMALQQAGAALISRLPNDYTQMLPGANYGSVTTQMDPDTGLAMMLVQYVEHKVAYAEWRLQVMLGAGVGDPRGGLCITSN